MAARHRNSVTEASALAPPQSLLSRQLKEFQMSRKTHRPVPLELNKNVPPIPGSTLSAYRPAFLRGSGNDGRRPSTVAEEAAGEDAVQSRWESRNVERIFEDHEDSISETSSIRSVQSTHSLPEVATPSVARWVTLEDVESPREDDLSDVATPKIISRITDVLDTPTCAEWHGESAGPRSKAPKYARILGSMPIDPSSPQPVLSPVGSRRREVVSFDPRPLNHRPSRKVKAVLGIGLAYPTRPDGSPPRTPQYATSGSASRFHSRANQKTAKSRPPPGLARAATLTAADDEELRLMTNPRARHTMQNVSQIIGDWEVSDDEGDLTPLDLQPWMPLHIGKGRQSDLPQPSPPTPASAALAKSSSVKQVPQPCSSRSEVEVQRRQQANPEFTQSSVELLAPVAYSPPALASSPPMRSPSAPAFSTRYPPAKAERCPIMLSRLPDDEIDIFLAPSGELGQQASYKKGTVFDVDDNWYTTSHTPAHRHKNVANTSTAIISGTPPSDASALSTSPPTFKESPQSMDDGVSLAANSRWSDYSDSGSDGGGGGRRHGWGRGRGSVMGNVRAGLRRMVTSSSSLSLSRQNSLQDHRRVSGDSSTGTAAATTTSEHHHRRVSSIRSTRVTSFGGPRNSARPASSGPSGGGNGKRSTARESFMSTMTARTNTTTATTSSSACSGPASFPDTGGGFTAAAVGGGGVRRSTGNMAYRLESAPAARGVSVGPADHRHHNHHHSHHNQQLLQPQQGKKSPRSLKPFVDVFGKYLVKDKAERRREEMKKKIRVIGLEGATTAPNESAGRRGRGLGMGMGGSWI